MTEEEKRLDEMMEVDRINSIKIDSEIEKTRKEQRLLGAMKIMEQIQENEQVRVVFQFLCRCCHSQPKELILCILSMI